jgi:multiple sugar transport system permease protein
VSEAVARGPELVGHPSRRGAELAGRHAIDRLIVAMLLVGGVIMMLPFAWMFSTSWRLARDSFSLPPLWWPTKWHVENYREVLDNIPFVAFVLNSLQVTIAITLGQLVTCSMAAYAFARLRFRGRDVLFLVFLSQLMVPQQVTIIPVFILIRVFGLLDTHWALIIPALFSAFGTFLLRQFFLTIPNELEDAARVDGAGYVRTFLQIILPLAGPALATLTIFTFNFYWNEFFRPLLFISTWERMTLPLGLTIMKGFLGVGNVAAIMAGVSMGILPVLVVFLLAQRYLIEGVTLTGMKG